ELLYRALRLAAQSSDARVAVAGIGFDVEARAAGHGLEHARVDPRADRIAVDDVHRGRRLEQREAEPAAGGALLPRLGAVDRYLLEALGIRGGHPAAAGGRDRERHEAFLQGALIDVHVLLHPYGLGPALYLAARSGPGF